MSTELEVRVAIIWSLREWGVDPKVNKTHKQFHERAISISISYFNQSTSDDDDDDEDSEYEEEPFESFPKDTKDSIECVLKSQLENSDEAYWFHEEDTLDTFHQPYFVREDGKAIKKSTYSHYKQIDLDSFTRFSQTKLTKEENYFREWSEEETFEGYAFEAILFFLQITRKACLE